MSLNDILILSSTTPNLTSVLCPWSCPWTQRLSRSLVTLTPTEAVTWSIHCSPSAQKQTCVISGNYQQKLNSHYSKSIKNFLFYVRHTYLYKVQQYIYPTLTKIIQFNFPLHNSIYFIKLYFPREIIAINTPILRIVQCCYFFGRDFYLTEGNRNWFGKKNFLSLQCIFFYQISRDYPWSSKNPCKKNNSIEQYEKWVCWLIYRILRQITNLEPWNF